MAKDTQAAAQTPAEKERSIPELKPGMTVRVNQRIQERNAKGEIKERIQFFEGLILTVKHGKEAGASFTVRKVSDGVGVEKTFPLHLPTIESVVIKKQVKARRSKLYFLKRGYKKRLRVVTASEKK